MRGALKQLQSAALMLCLNADHVNPNNPKNWGISGQAILVASEASFDGELKGSASTEWFTRARLAQQALDETLPLRALPRDWWRIASFQNPCSRPSGVDHEFE